MTTLDWLANLWTAFVSLLPTFSIGVGIVLAAWFFGSFPVAVVIGRVLRGAERGRQ